MTDTLTPLATLEKFMSVSDVSLETEVSLRTAAKQESMGGGQGSVIVPAIAKLNASARFYHNFPTGKLFG